MIRTLFALLAFGITAAVASGATTPLSQSASVTASTARAGARPVTLTLQLHYEMQCGNPGTGMLRVKLPAQAQLPAKLPAGSALLDGKRVNPAVVAGKLQVALPARPHLMCDVIGPGTLTFVVTKAANVGNPAKAGSYTVSAWSGTKGFQAQLRVTT